MRESAQALRAYQDYEAQEPPRSLDRLVQAYRRRPEGVPTKQLSRLKRWSVAHAWQERIRAYEQAIAEQATREEAAERKRARRQRVQVARGCRAKGVEALSALSAQTLARHPLAIVRLLQFADDTERRDLGEPDQRVEVGGPDGGDFSFTIRLDPPVRDDSRLLE